MSTLVTDLQDVAALAGYSIEDSIIGSTDTTTRQLLAWAQEVILEIDYFHEWPKLWKSYSFTLVDGQATYPVPGDFSHYHYDTFWRSSQGWQLYGPMSPQEYAALVGLDSAPTEKRMALRGVTDNEILIYPTPGADEGIVAFEYQSDRPVKPRTWAASQDYAAGAYTFYNGNYYSTTAGGTTDVTPPTHTSGTVSDGAVNWTWYDGKYNRFLADTDEPVAWPRTFKRGVFERFAQTKQIDFEPIYYKMIEDEFAKQSPGRTFSMVGENTQIIMARNGVASFGRVG